MEMQPIYANGGYRVMPLVSRVRVETRDGRAIGTYTVEQIEDAVAEVDEMAQRDGERVHRTFRG